MITKDHKESQRSTKSHKGPLRTTKVTKDHEITENYEEPQKEYINCVPGYSKLEQFMENCIF